MRDKTDKLSRDIIRRMNEEITPTPKKERMISFKRDQFYTVMVIVAFSVGILTGYFIWGTNPTASAAIAVPQQGQVAAVDNQAPPTRYEIPTEGFFSVGPEDAEITLIEFSDFGCSFCAKWHNETYEDLMAAYPDKIRFVYRNVPFRAFPAAEAAMCASEQDAYWPYHDKLFSYEYGLSDDAYIQYAEDLNLDMDSFNTCMSEHRYQEFIQNDMDFATQLGIQSTPTFFINGLALVGAQPIGAFKQVIDLELAGGS
ncbi:MAG: DsbA family protein [Anaerolineae bacterium]|nr:DsbA family protein [Anaerolineae bacterium]